MKLYKGITITTVMLMVLLSAPILDHTMEVYASKVDTKKETKYTETIQIHSAEEFLAFAQECKLDSYSLHKQIILENDIDLKEQVFHGVPIFQGRFDGNGHTIKGLSMTEKQDAQGLFRHIGSKGIVANLKVEGIIDTNSDYIGGIAGENYGTIERCQFTGIIRAHSTVGGIAGENHGTILESFTVGSVLGQNIVGGITGNNLHTILHCKNLAKVNTDVVEANFPITALPDTFTYTDLIEFNAVIKEEEVTDIGGIAGKNTGILQNVTNESDIGYPHVGYHVGGIVGKQSGYIKNAYNTGKVFGRKEVGGIVGLVVPYVNSVFSPSKLQQLEIEITKLSDLTSNFTQNSQVMNGVVSEDLSNLNQAVNDSRLHLEALSQEAEGMLDHNIESVHTISVTVADIIDQLVPISKAYSNGMEDVVAAMDQVPAIQKCIQDILEQLGEDAASIEPVAAEVSAAQETITQVNESAKVSETALEQLQETVLEGANNSQSIEKELDQFTSTIEDTVSNLQQAQEGLSEAKELSGTIPSSEELDPLLEQLEEEIQKSITSLEQGITHWDTAKEGMNTLLQQVADQKEVSFVGFTEEYGESKEKLSTSLTSVSENIEKLNQSLSGNTAIILKDLEAMNQQFKTVLNTTIGLITDLSKLTKDSLQEVEDISYQDLDQITSGKILSSKNSGTIDGDVHLGGIVGAISLDVGLDLEADWITKIFGREKEIKRGIAVIEDCANEGDVTAKKDGVGGIVGYMNFGFVTNSSSNAKIESIEGDYVGGIAGNSVARIENSYGKNILSGRSYIGGIAGLGKDIRNSYVMTTIQASKGFSGGIAGATAENSKIVNNYFVSEELGGIDGISYASKAEPISYDKLLKVKGLPKMFQTMNTVFYANNKRIVSVKTTFQGDIEADHIPIVPSEEGEFGYWDSFETRNIVMDQRVEAVYEPNITTLGSDDMEGNLHTILVEGIFTNQEKIQIASLEKQKKIVDVYKVTVNNENTPIESVHYYMKDRCKKIEIYENKKWVEVSFKKDGLYAVFQPNSMRSELTFRVS